MKRFSLFVIVGIIGFASILLAQKTEITFWEGMEGSLGTTLQQITDMFNSQNPTIEVKLVFVGNGSELDSKLLAAAETKTLPTISQAYPTWAAALVSKGIVTPMQQFDGFNELAQEIYPAVLNIGKIDSKFYGLPFNQQVYLLYYRPAMFEEAGINPPTTLDELANDAKILTVTKDGKVVRYGLAFRDMSWIFTAIARQFGGGTYMKNGKIVINSGANLQAMTYLTDLVKNGYAYTKSGYFDNELTTSSVAMILGGSANLPFDLSDIAGQKDGIKMIPIPVGPAGKTSPILAGEVLLIFNTATPEQQEAAWQYAKFLLSPKIQMYWAIHTNYSPLNEEVLNLQEWKSYVAQSEYGVGAIADGLDNAASYALNLPYWTSVDSAIGTAFEDAVNSVKTPSDALSWAQEQAESIQSTFYEK
jgi:multiple sugar transport system substrate-binding protein